MAQLPEQLLRLERLGLKRLGVARQEASLQVRASPAALPRVQRARARAASPAVPAYPLLQCGWWSRLAQVGRAQQAAARARQEAPAPPVRGSAQVLQAQQVLETQVPQAQRALHSGLRPARLAVALARVQAVVAA